jgi:hypothetical protein
VLLQETFVTRNAPPLCKSALVLIGQNSHGQWVAQEQSGLFGGLFAKRSDAVRYALFENGHHPEAIIEPVGLVELSFAPPQPVALAQRRVA